MQEVIGEKLGTDSVDSIERLLRQEAAQPGQVAAIGLHGVRAQVALDLEMLQEEIDGAIKIGWTGHGA